MKTSQHSSSMRTARLPTVWGVGGGGRACVRAWPGNLLGMEERKRLGSRLLNMIFPSLVVCEPPSKFQIVIV